MEVMERPGLGKQRYAAQLSSPIQYHDESRRASAAEARMTSHARADQAHQFFNQPGTPVSRTSGATWGVAQFDEHERNKFVRG